MRVSSSKLSRRGEHLGLKCHRVRIPHSLRSREPACGAPPCGTGSGPGRCPSRCGCGPPPGRARGGVHRGGQVARRECSVAKAV